MRESSRMGGNCYRPHPRVESYLRRKLSFERRRTELTRAGKTLPQEDKQRRSLDTEKVDILNNYIFPSMANVVKFLEYSQEDELREVFEDDIKDLFFGKSHLKQGNPSPIFQRFLQASTSWKPQRGERRRSSVLNRTPLHQTVKLIDFRLGLLDYLYYVLGLTAIFNAPKYVFDDKNYVSIVKQDFARLGVWIRLLTKNADVQDFDNNTVARPALF